MELTHKQIQDVIYEWLKLVLEKKEAIDISKGQEERLKVSRTDFNKAVLRLYKEPGYATISFGKVTAKPVRVLYSTYAAKEAFPKIEKIGVMNVRTFEKMLNKKRKELDDD